jgi:TolA-binding protein
MGSYSIRRITVFAVFLLLQVSCSVDSVKNRYLLAEKLWSEGSYAAAVLEFDRVSRRDPDGDLGRRAMLRSAMTQTLFLKEHTEAIRKFARIVEREGDSELGWEAQKEIGEILFSRQENWSEALSHYQQLLKRRPDASEAPVFQYRIAKSYLNRWAFDPALEAFDTVISKWPGSALAAEAMMDRGTVWLIRGEQRPGDLYANRGKEVYREAIRNFDSFLKAYPDHKRAPEAVFGMASAFEELEQLDQALILYERIQESYPVPQSVQIKLHRLKERQARRSR